MTKVYPSLINNSAKAAENKLVKCSELAEDANALTVWRKSLLFNCNGFTVFDSAGNLVFRVDNYVAGIKGEIVLMDAAGKPLFTVRRKRLSLSDNWQIFDGEARSGSTTTAPRCSVRRHVSLRGDKALAHVIFSGGVVVYEVEGSYGRRSCSVYDQKRRKVAEIRRKEAAVGGVALGGDVFRLLVDRQFDTAFAMALVIVLDQMFGSSSRR